MMRIKFIKDYKPHTAGKVVVVSNKKAQELVKAGIAILTKDMTNSDMRTT